MKNIFNLLLFVFWKVWLICLVYWNLWPLFECPSLFFGVTCIYIYEPYIFYAFSMRLISSMHGIIYCIMKCNIFHTSCFDCNIFSSRQAWAYILDHRWHKTCITNTDNSWRLLHGNWFGTGNRGCQFVLLVHPQCLGIRPTRPRGLQNIIMA